MAVGPCASSKRATAESGTAAPEPVATLSDSSSCAVAARALLELHADRHLPVADVELGEIGADVADGGDAHGLRDGFRGDAELGRDVGDRHHAQLRAVELRRRHHVGEQRDALGLAGEVGRRVATRRRRRGRRRPAGTGAGRCPSGTRSGCRACRPCCAPIASLHLVLGELAALLGHQIDDERGLAHLRAASPCTRPPMTNTLLHLGALAHLGARSCP